MTAVQSEPYGAAHRLGEEAEDEALAAAARSLYLTAGFADLQPDRRTRSALGGRERLLAERERARVDHLPRGRLGSMSGRLAVTTDRLILVRRSTVTLASLEQLEDTWLIADRLLVMLASGVAFAIRAMRPRLLRVELAEARAQWLDAQASSDIEGSAAAEAWPRR